MRSGGSRSLLLLLVEVLVVVVVVAVLVPCGVADQGRARRGASCGVYCEYMSRKVERCVTIRVYCVSHVVMRVSYHDLYHDSRYYHV